MPEFFFQSVSADLFQASNLYALVYADRLSGWTVVHQWCHCPSSKEVIRAVLNNFVELRVPLRFRSDGGMQFDSKGFRDTMAHWGVEFRPSSPPSPLPLLPESDSSSSNCPTLAVKPLDSVGEPVDRAGPTRRRSSRNHPGTIKLITSLVFLVWLL